MPACRPALRQSWTLTSSVVAMVAALGLAATAAEAQQSLQRSQTTVPLPQLGDNREDPSRRTVETEGAGPSVEAARAAAVQAAVEQVAGVYVDSSRRAELLADGTDVRSTFRERVVAQSNGFVERVTTLRTWRENGEDHVRIRADVVVNRLIEIMRTANVPLIAIDQASMGANLQTQFARDEHGRELVAHYLADLVRNVAIQLDGMKVSPLPGDPDMAQVTAQATFRPRPDYVERGRRIMAEVGREMALEMRSSTPESMMLCSPESRSGQVDFGPFGPVVRGLACRGLDLSPKAAARLDIEERDWTLVGLGFQQVVWNRDYGFRGYMNLNGIEMGSAGPFLVLEALDAASGVIVRASEKLGTECARAFSTTVYDSATFDQVQLPLLGRGGWKPTVHVFAPDGWGRGVKQPMPSTCSYKHVRVLGDPRAPGIRRSFLAVLPRSALERAAHLRLSLAWQR